VKFMTWCKRCRSLIRNSNTWCSDCHRVVVHEMNNRPIALKQPPWEDVTTCTLHVFFLSLEETDEQIELLRKPEPKGEPRIATSRVMATNLAQINPINRTAAKVVNVR